MSFSSMLIHRCTIQRYMPTGGTDTMGHPLAAWTNLATNVKCNLQWRPVTELKNDGLVAVASSELLFVPKGQDITEKDRVTAVVDIDGVSVDSNIFNVTEVRLLRGKNREHHKQVILLRVRPGG